MNIPAKLHFCWIGTTLPWAYVFALLSAAERSGLQDIVLHHTDALEDNDRRRALMNEPRLRLSRLDAPSYLSQAGGSLGVGDDLATLYARLEAPVMRADVLRAAILYQEGGIYLDLDTLTVASLLPLTATQQFVGSEFIVWPLPVRQSRSPVLWARHLTLDVLRKMCRTLPQGWKMFQRIERFYVRSVNNAVMGSEPRSRFLADYLRGMLALPQHRQASPYALGPHLLQEIVRRDATVTIHEPRVFYPLAPEISEHWFRTVRHARLGNVLSAETRVVHWYASVRTKQLVARITPAYVAQHRQHQLYSALVCSLLDPLPGCRNG